MSPTFHERSNVQTLIAHGTGHMSHVLVLIKPRVHASSQQRYVCAGELALLLHTLLCTHTSTEPGINHGKVAVNMQRINLDNAHVAQVIETMPHTLQTMHDCHTQTHLIDMTSVIALVLCDETLGDNTHLLKILRTERQHGLHHRVPLVEQTLNVSTGTAHAFIRQRRLTITECNAALTGHV